MSRNGQRHPARPRIAVSGGAASPEETAAIAAAIEQFLRDTAPPPADAGPSLSPWLRAGLLEGTRRRRGRRLEPGPGLGRLGRGEQRRPALGPRCGFLELRGHAQQQVLAPVGRHQLHADRQARLVVVQRQ